MVQISQHYWISIHTTNEKVRCCHACGLAWQNNHLLKHVIKLSILVMVWYSIFTKILKKSLISQKFFLLLHIPFKKVNQFATNLQFACSLKIPSSQSTLSPKAKPKISKQQFSNSQLIKLNIKQLQFQMLIKWWHTEMNEKKKWKNYIVTN